MKLTPAQTDAVKSWIATGASIADVQKRLLDEFQLTLTYRDTRFLIDDLGLDIQAPAPKPATPPPAPAQPAPGAPKGAPAQDAELVDDAGHDDPGSDFPAEPAPAGAGSVKVEVDRLTRPGTVVSGSVTFRDGNTGRWALDQYGRLIFDASTPGYRPGPADLQAFQRELSAVLQRQGY